MVLNIFVSFFFPLNMCIKKIISHSLGGSRHPHSLVSKASLFVLSDDFAHCVALQYVFELAPEAIRTKSFLLALVECEIRQDYRQNTDRSHTKPHETE